MKRHKRNTGPALTKKVKDGLLKEIAEFKEKDTKRVIEQEAVGRPDRDAYQEWVDTHDGMEDVRANPDVLAEDQTIVWGRATTDRDVLSAMEQLPEILSHREMQVWRYVMRDGMSTTDAANRLRISQQVAAKYLKSAKAKVHKHFTGDLNE